MTRIVRPSALPALPALERLRAGNERFVTGDARVVRAWHPGLVKGQSPFAVVLGCSDSRAPAEYVFDQGLGDLFVVRVAGNIVAPSLVGSVEFATSNFGTNLVVVMGHTQCGAVDATLRAIARGNGPESRNIQSIVERISPHLHGMGERLREGGDPSILLPEAVRINALASARELRASSELLRALVEEGDVKIVAAVFDLATGVVTFLDP